MSAVTQDEMAAVNQRILEINQTLQQMQAVQAGEVSSIRNDMREMGVRVEDQINVKVESNVRDKFELALVKIGVMLPELLKDVSPPGINISKIKDRPQIQANTAMIIKTTVVSIAAEAIFQLADVYSGS